jgi:aspartate ammonia-lyase
VPASEALRIERDSLGELALPADALYGIHTARALANLRFSRHTLGDCPAYLHALLRVKRAAARANAEAGVIEISVAERIERGALALEAGAHASQFPVDLLGGGGSIGVHMNVNEVLARLSGATLAQVSASQSTADVCHTAARLAIRALAQPLDAALATAIATLRAKAAELDGVRTLARTCLRDALPVPAGVLVAGWAGVLDRARAALECAVAPLDALSLGGTVIGTGDGAPPVYRARVIAILARIEGRPLRAHADPCDALQNGDELRAVSSATVAIANALLKIGQDLRLLFSGPEGGFGELELPHVQEGSSFFAGKSNPVVPETAICCALAVIGIDRAVQAAVERSELHLHVFDGFAAANVFEALELETNALVLLEARCLRGLRANAARCEALAETARVSRPAPDPSRRGASSDRA